MMPITADKSLAQAKTQTIDVFADPNS